MARTLDVNFRPIKFEEYHDFIVLETQAGRLAVRVSAYLPTLSLKLPSQLDFNYCPAKELTRISFIVENDGRNVQRKDYRVLRRLWWIGDVDVKYNWESFAPFSVMPQKGVLRTKSTAQVRQHMMNSRPLSIHPSRRLLSRLPRNLLLCMIRISSCTRTGKRGGSFSSATRYRS